MAMTTAQQTDAYRFFSIAFDAAPGVTYMNQLADAYAAGMTTKEIVNVFTTKDQFNSKYPKFLSNEAFASSLVANVVGTSATDAAKAEAAADVAAALNAGWSRGDVIYQVFTNLAGKAADDATWGNTAKLMANKVAVAKYVTETALTTTTDLAVLSKALSGVTATTDVSTPAALAAAASAVTLGSTYTLTTGADTVNGTAGNDTINALSIKADGTAGTTLSGFDVIDGGAGSDTLNIYTSGADNNAFPATASVKNVEIVNIFNAAAAAALGDASKFAGVAQLWQHSTAAAVTNLGDATVAGFKGTTGALSVTSTNTATKAAVALDGIAEGGSVTFGVPVAAPANGGALNSVTVSGTVADTNLNGVVATTNVNVTVGRDVQSLAVNTAVDTTLAVTDGAGKTVTTVDASASAGKLTYAAANTVANVSTGKGSDVVTLATAYTATLKAASVSGGEGNDTLTVNVTNAADIAGATVSASGGAGNDTINLNIINGASNAVAVTVDAGVGNDTVDINFAVKSTDVIDGGEGADTVALAGKAARVADDFIVINKVLKNFETIKFKTAEGAATALDASLLAASYATLDFAAGSSVDNVGAQALIARGNLTAEAAGYKAIVAPATVATYAGTLNIASVASGNVTANAETVKLAVTASSNGNGAANTTVATTLLGDAKTAVVTLSAATDNNGTSTVTTDDVLDTAALTFSNAGANTKMASLTVSGNGTATVNNVGGDLVTIDASGLASVDIAGKAVTGLVYTTSNTKAETIKLGAGLDTVTITGSTYSIGLTNMDTVEGISLVLNAGKTAFDASKGDVLAVTGLNNLAAAGKFTTTQTDLDLALLDAAKFKVSGADVDTLAFHMNGNTYIYQDTSGDSLVTADDILVKLTGTIDLDVLVAGL